MRMRLQELLNITAPKIEILTAKGLTRAISSHRDLLVWFCVPWLKMCKEGGAHFAQAIGGMQASDCAMYMTFARH